MALFQNLLISTKLPLLILVLVLLPCGTVALISYVEIRAGLIAENEKKMVALLASRKNALQNYLGMVSHDLALQSKNPLVIEMILRFDDAWSKIPGDKTQRLQDLYITQNPHQVGEKDRWLFAKDSSLYSRLHQRYHPWMRQFFRQKGYYDIFLINTEGDLIYSVFKERDYATNLIRGIWKDTDLAHLFQTIRANARTDFQVFYDYKHYAPSRNAPASFIGTPVFEGEHFVGVLAFQMPAERINRIMQVTAGMGETGETYLVGADKYMHSDSRFFNSSTVLKTQVNTKAADAALAGKSGVRIVEDYRGVDVLSAFSPFEFMSNSFGILAEINMSEVLKPVYALRNFLFFVFGTITLVILGVGLLMARSITRPISRMTTVMSSLAQGDTRIEVPKTDRRDEIGQMANALWLFKENVAERRKLKAETEKMRQEELAHKKRAEEAKAASQREEMVRERKQAEAKQQHQAQQKEERLKAENEAQRIQQMNELADRFERQVASVLNEVSKSAKGMEARASSMLNVAEESKALSLAASKATEQASGHASAVASAAKQLSASIEKILTRVNHASKMAATAQEEVQKTHEIATRLSRATNKIGQVVNFIQDFAHQTHLIALNTEIVAARAGVHGKGFTVLGTEVGKLAQQTAQATEEIAEQVADIRQAADRSVSAIQAITQTITEVSQTSAAIDTAMGEQTAATAQIAHGVAQADQETQEVATHILDVTQKAVYTGEESEKVQRDARDLVLNFDQLSHAVQRFLHQVRSDHASKTSP